MTKLREKNLAYLGQHYQITHRRLTDPGVPIEALKLITKNGALEDFQFADGKRLYGNNCESVTLKQIAAFRQNPPRVPITPKDFNLTPAVNRFVEDLGAWNEANLTSSEVAGAPIRDIGYIFIFGVGAGLHLPLLMQSGLAQTIVLIEPNISVFNAALDVVDFENLIEAAKRRGANIELLVGLDVETFSAALHAKLVFYGNLFLEGSTIFIHHNASGMSEALAAFEGVLPGHFQTYGFFEDAVLMARNCYGNVRRDNPPSLLNEATKFAKRNTPVLIVGSGPSLDKDLKHIHRLKNHCLIVSLGTTLGILLREGLAPDLHMEIENYLQNLKDLQRHMTHGDLSQTRVISSLTVNPQVGPNFKSQWSFLRPGNCPSHLFADIRPLNFSTPIVGNAAFSALAVLGFDHIYLVGMDCGRRAGDNHHSTKSVYYLPDYENVDAVETLEKQEEFPVEGNFGGEILTSKILNASKLQIEQCQKMYQLKVVNCSDGAKFNGIPGQRLEAVTFEGEKLDKNAILEEIHQSLPTLAHTFEGIRQVLKTKLALDESYFATKAAKLRRHIEEKNSLRQFALDCFNESNLKTDSPPLGRAFMTGTLQSLLRVGIFWSSRISNPVATNAFLNAYADLFEKWGAAIQEEFNGFIQDMIDEKESLRQLSDRFQGDPGISE